MSLVCNGKRMGVLWALQHSASFSLHYINMKVIKDLSSAWNEKKMYPFFQFVFSFKNKVITTAQGNNV